MGPAVIPSGGEEVRVLYSWKSRLEAIELAMMCVDCLIGRERRGEEVNEVFASVDGTRRHAAAL